MMYTEERKELKECIIITERKWDIKDVQEIRDQLGIVGALVKFLHETGLIRRK